MSNEYAGDSLLDMFLFETEQLLEQLEQIIINGEKESDYNKEAINEVFRIMHTIKGSSAMMMFDNLAKLAHSVEDVFFYLREGQAVNVDYTVLSDLILESVDFIKVEADKIKANRSADGNADDLVNRIKDYLVKLKTNNTSGVSGYKTKIFEKKEPNNQWKEQQIDQQIEQQIDQQRNQQNDERKDQQRNQQKEELEDQHANQQYDELEDQQRNHMRNQKNGELEDQQRNHQNDERKDQKVLQQSDQQRVLHKDQPGNLSILCEQKVNKYLAKIHFDAGCEMENVRAYTIIHNLKNLASEISYTPADILENDESIQLIRKDGFQITVKSNLNYERMYEFFHQTIFLKDLELIELNSETDNRKAKKEITKAEPVSVNTAQSIISVSVSKLDKLMDLVGEMVIAEAMVIQNPDLKGLQLQNFTKAARQLSKITTDIQDMVMSIRMVPLSATFNKMHRVVRDMCKKLDKEVDLDIIGEETEVDKNIIEHISDPLMHLVRNSIDHGIEQPVDRQANGKSKVGNIILEAKNAGSDVVIIIRDDGKGLNKEKILKKAKENNLLFKNEAEMSEKEIFNLIMLPGFSTTDKVTEFSGRGVGMDIVRKNIEAVGGSISVDSVEGKGTTITLKIPLTLAIIDGMNIRVGNARYTIPTISIKESFRPKAKDILTDPEGNEMIMVRGQCYLIRRLHEMFKINSEITHFEDGIMLMIEQEDKMICLFADELLGQQQVVVKALPQYIQNFNKVRGLGGCTLLGDGSISLILDVTRLFS